MAQIIDSFLNQVNLVIKKELTSEVYLINEIGNYIISSGGKRMRPLTTVLAGKILGCNSSQLFRQAAMIEFIHTSTLLHDDVVDESALRRGKKTANAVFGNAASILVGDFLYSRAFQIMQSTNNMKIMEIMANATNIIATGEVMQLLNIGNIDIKEKDYFNVIQYKTATLFESAAHIGAVIAKANLEDENNLIFFSKYFGTSFQIIDDILDYSGNATQIGKNIGDDLAEGKITLPLIYLLNNANSKDLPIIKKNLKENNKDSFKIIYDYIMSYSALDYCYKKAQEIIDNSIYYLKKLPQNEYTDILYDMVNKSLARIN